MRTGHRAVQSATVVVDRHAIVNRAILGRETGIERGSMGRILGFVVAAGLLGGAIYLLGSYIANAPAVSLRIVVVAGSVLLVLTAVFAIWIWSWFRPNP